MLGCIPGYRREEVGVPASLPARCVHAARTLTAELMCDDDSFSPVVAGERPLRRGKRALSPQNKPLSPAETGREW